VTNQFLQQVYKNKKVNDLSSQQFLLDLTEIKAVLIQLPILSTKSSSEGRVVPESYSNFVNKCCLRLEQRFKVLGYPLEQVRDAYVTLVKDKSQEDFENILLLRGVKKTELAAYKLT